MSNPESCSDVMTITENIIAGVMILIGLPICFAGKKFFKPLLFAVGFMLGWWATWTIIYHSAKRCWDDEHETPDPDYWACNDSAAGIIFQVVGGFMGALLLFKFFTFGILVIGGLAGALGSAFLYNLINGWLSTPYDEAWLFWVVVVIGTIMAVLASHKFFEFAFMLGSAFVGAYFVFAGIDSYLVLADKYGGPVNGVCHGSISLTTFWDAASEGFDCAGMPTGDHICFIMISCWIVTTVLGFISQMRMPKEMLPGKNTQQQQGDSYRPMSSQVENP